MWWSTKVNRVCGGQRKLIEYMAVNESLVAKEVNRICGGQRKLIEYVVVNGS